ncbi:acetyltransferase [Marinitoga sp. 1135]|uniref:Acetyltransferase, ribosomal protein N-acetylase n=1 Tax=Marinitoga piezophila (strain DSM 14283 / JCM 11233 / KA3) TaxID=443254 RepID=H2J4J5_MARPK|nr:MULTISPECIES: GNAT family protein [Marinitoga]AEX85937.1 acetyltransferase, ribosomal protein N-acetylase [Marinitoga piezophila KA3]APT76365.1 acetyltransferase [Marinitoga sp. 1137]NUU96135.1 acetyltransferase [Marinitoga sp. 1135]
MLEGKLVKLRAYSKNDLEKVLEYINDEEVRKNLMPGIPYPFRMEDEEKWYEKLNPFGGGKYDFAIELKKTGEYIGGCGVNEIDWKNSVATVGIFIGKPFFNKGYGTEAMKLLVDFVFKEMNINKVKLHVFSFNQRAIKSYEKVGFKVEGILREQIFREGKYHDEVIMGILRKEWNK